MKYYEQTKKDNIIKLATNEPFLSISDIAEMADTTQRYVRTILSEADISLMKLRKENYERLEKENKRLRKTVEAFNHFTNDQGRN